MNTAFKRRTPANRLLMLLVLTFLIITSCKKKFDAYYGNTGSASVYVYDKLKQDTNFSIFADGLDRVGLVQQINSGGLYTVFAPVNDAFRQYFSANGYGSIKDVPQATLFQILNFHITNNLWYYYSFQQRNLINSKGLYLTRGGKFLQIDLSSNDTLKVNGIPVIKSLRDISSDNAVIHGIGTVMVPKPNLEQVLASDSYLKNSTFYKLMQVVADSAYDRVNSYAKNGSTQIDSIFYKTYSFLSNVNTSVEYRQNSTTNTQGGDPVFTTILMPKDDSLNAVIAPALARIDNSVSNKIAALSPTYVKGILSPYFISDTFSYTSTKFITKPAGVNYVSTSVQTIPNLTAASFFRTDITASNGIVHVLNFNFPQSDISVSAVGQASMDPQLSMFMLALQKASMVNLYASAGKVVTLFAPTNAAFTAANFDVKNMILDGVVLTQTQFNNIIKNHIIETNFPTAASLTGSIATVINLNNNTLTFGSSGTTATTILGVTANITQPFAYKALTSTNGYVYKIDKILIPSQ